MSLSLILDAEALVGGWLREHPDLIALDVRVAGRTPSSMLKPWVRVTQLDASPITGTYVEHVMDYMLQLDCYAGKDATDAFTGQAEASIVARTVRAVLRGLEGTVSDGATIARVRFSGDVRAPDTALEPARERRVLTAEIMLHPV